ncbi:hypothetical protein KAJ87_01455 [Candidatus Pacearchaeota archaeon]|nr:hypothetical protein [Candidatus Pacearchaeota archaeon]
MPKNKQSRLKDIFEESIKEHCKKPSSEPKSYEELIKPIYGVVKDIKGYNYNPFNETRFGEKSNIHNSGYRATLEIMLENDSLTKKLIFNGGNCQIGEGDKIKAYVFAGETRIIGISNFKHSNYKKEIFIPRKLDKEEIALYIEKIKEGKAKETYYSVNYSPKK